MKYLFKWGRYPDNPDFLLKINNAATRLYSKLQSLDLDSLDISDYNKRYFGRILFDLKASLQLRGYILAWVLHQIPHSLKDIVLVDYGGGSGLLSIFAKELGVGHVCYNDIFSDSCHDSKVIAQSLGNQADAYIHGELNDVIRYLKDSSLNCHAIASYDVIEHIYDMDTFLKSLHLLSKEHLHVFMSSGANMLNPRQNRLLTKVQIDREYHDRKPKWGVKPTDCLKSHFSVRKEMIQDYLNTHNKNLSKDLFETFSRNTRGMIKPDIEKSLDAFFSTDMIPPEPKHPTNTCDPYNGNWAEHLMDPYELSKTLADTGFDVKVNSGFYGEFSKPFKRLIGNSLNVPIYVFPKFGIRFAPFYSLYGIKKMENV